MGSKRLECALERLVRSTRFSTCLAADDHVERFLYLSPQSSSCRLFQAVSSTLKFTRAVGEMEPRFRSSRRVRSTRCLSLSHSTRSRSQDERTAERTRTLPN